MGQLLSNGSGSQEGLSDLTAVDGDPNPTWSEQEHKLLLQELEDLEQKVKAAPVVNSLLHREITIRFDESEEVFRPEKGPYERLGSIALSLN